MTKADSVGKKCPRTLRGRAYDLRYEDLVERDGEKCAYCDKPGPYQVHHRDANPQHNRLANLSLACPQCNTREHWRTLKSGRQSQVEREKEKTVGLTVTASDMPYLVASRETRKSEEVQPVFRKWVVDELVRDGEALWASLQEDGAELFMVDLQTTDRWLKKMTSRPGPCERYKAPEGKALVWWVRLKPAFFRDAARGPPVEVAEAS